MSTERSVPIPANIDLEDRLLGRLTLRQLALLTGPAVLIWAGWTAANSQLPLPVYAALASPVAAIAAALAFGQRDGLSADRLAVAAIRHLRSPRRLAGGPVMAPSAWSGRRDLPGRVDLRARGVDAEGVVDLGPDGSILVCRATASTFSLREPAERAAMVAAFGRFANSLDAAVQFTVRAERADIRQAIARVDRAAHRLRNGAQRSAATEHAAFLTDLAGRPDVLIRRVFVTFRHPAPPTTAAPVLRRRAEQATAALAPAGIVLAPLSRRDVAAVLARAAEPDTAPVPNGMASPLEPIRGKR